MKDKGYYKLAVGVLLRFFLNKERKEDEKKIYGGLYFHDLITEYQTHLFNINGTITKTKGSTLREEQFKVLKNSLIKHNLKLNNVLDAGCGNMITAKYFDALGFKYTGTDLNPERLKIGKVFNGLNLDVKQADIRELPFKDKSFDLVFTSHVLERLGQDIPKALKEIKRVGRYYACFEPTYEIQNFFGKIHSKLNHYPDHIVSKIQESGFELLEVSNPKLGTPFNLPMFVLARSKEWNTKERDLLDLIDMIVPVDQKGRNKGSRLLRKVGLPLGWTSAANLYVAKQVAKAWGEGRHAVLTIGYDAAWKYYSDDPRSWSTPLGRPETVEIDRVREVRGRYGRGVIVAP